MRLARAQRLNQAEESSLAQDLDRAQSPADVLDRALDRDPDLIRGTVDDRGRAHVPDRTRNGEEATASIVEQDHARDPDPGETGQRIDVARDRILVRVHIPGIVIVSVARVADPVIERARNVIDPRLEAERDRTQRVAVVVRERLGRAHLRQRLGALRLLVEITHKTSLNHLRNLNFKNYDRKIKYSK
jgi:hypothetical protein